jgi:Mrp family chromosome partitioning ATPase/DUF971 family protein
MPPAASTAPFAPRFRGLDRVRHILAVSSCKGGVGKSTVAVNLAFALARRGRRVGLFDADVYGPSLPTLVRVEEAQVYQEGEAILPLVRDGVKLMSFGFVNREEEGRAAILRGPMVSQVVNQLLTGTDWGELDVLVIDYPPGTGDIQLTLAQIAPVRGAVIVTTPQRLSFVDVVKGIAMFDKLKAPTLTVVENMAWYQPSPDAPPVRLFGEGARARLVREYGFRTSHEIPVRPEISADGDRGEPFVLARPDDPVTARFLALADEVWREMETLAAGRRTTPTLTYEVGANLVLTFPDGRKSEFSPVALRGLCRSAHRVNELTGERTERTEDIPADLYPTALRPSGNYAVAVEWSDGKPPSLFPYDQLAAAFPPSP